MPAALKRYWAAKRRGKSKVRRSSMARRRGRKGGRRYGRTARRWGHSAKMTGKKMLGIYKDGVHISNPVIMTGLASAAFLNGSTAPESSAIGALMGEGGYSNYTWPQRISQATFTYLYVLTGKKPWVCEFTPSGNAGKPGMIIAAGIIAKMAGTVVNPMIRGSPVKL